MGAKAQTKTKKTAAKPGKSAGRGGRSTAARSSSGRSRPAAKRSLGKPAGAKRTTAKPAGAKRTATKPAVAKRRKSKNTVSVRGRVAAPAKESFALGKLGQVALTATDMDAAVAFYNNVLGLRLIARFDPPGLAFFNLGGGVRLLVSATASAASLYFSVHDLDAAVRDLKKRGVKFLQKPNMIHRDDAGEFGRKGVEEWMAFFNDPSGNLLALVERR